VYMCVYVRACVSVSVIMMIAYDFSNHNTFPFVHDISFYKIFEST